MNESNSKRSKPGDRLSELPDAVIFDLFWLLPMTDVVKTSVLSKRWRNLWITTPFLNFDNRAMSLDDNRLCKFVNRALLWWNGNRVLKFKFHSRHKLVKSMFSDIDLWVNFAKRNGVEELYLHMVCDTKTGMDGLEVYLVPQCLYSCSSLKELTLKDCNFEISGNVEWNQLESLRMGGVRVTLTAYVINQILLGSPQLEVFNLSYIHKGGNLSIQSNSLKELSIWKCICSYSDLSVASELRICTPNLETLEISGFPFSKCMLMNVSSLTHTTLGLLGLENYDQDMLLLRGVGFRPDLFSGNVLPQILPTIQHVENVELLFCCTKVLSDMKLKCMHSSFPNVKSLELECCFYDCNRAVGVLESFPQLERLVLKHEKRKDHKDDGASLRFEANLPESFLLQLRTVEVTWAEGDNVFPLIEILLKYASKLEKIVFQLKEINSPGPQPSPSSDSLFLMSQKLLRMRRSSTNCTIDLIKLHLES